MQADFHYYATYCAAFIAGYNHEQSLDIAYSAQLVDWCTRNFLSKIKGPSSAATTQSQIELADARTDLVGLQDITRIWASFHFLPGNLYAEKKSPRIYKQKYRLICNPNGPLVKDTVLNAKDKSLQAVGIAMHVLADTWAHRYFAGTPSLVINNTNYYFYEILNGDNGEFEQQIHFRHSTSTPDDLDKSYYSNSIYQPTENTIMNLGHGRAGHLPDYSFAKYKYLPAWADYDEIVKDNPADYYNAFCQMVYAMKFLRGDYPEFEVSRYEYENVSAYKDTIDKILRKRQIDACQDWKAFGESLSGKAIPDFDMTIYQDEYISADNNLKDTTFLGHFILAALSHKSLVTNKIFTSGNLLAGFSRDFSKQGFGGIKDFAKLLKDFSEGVDKNE